ncbi:hypothetical protein [Glycomyces sp. YM15]|uniref:hypothetical protein n=1 Tax=Glycomyces sp. YM15 TaxID=2800446 RepID=UPI0019661D96|nr:hypothetical protein [Glycomyces sp. YM15]
MSSTTIRYSGVPENSHSRRFEPEHSVEPTSGITADASTYSRPAPSTGIDRGAASDLTLKWRKRLRALADEDPAPDQNLTRQDPTGDHTANPYGPSRDLLPNGYNVTGNRTASDHDPSSDQTTGRFNPGGDPSPASAHTGESASSAFVPGFTPGKPGPLSSDPRHNRAFPHPENPGLFAEADGFYDWANRRLYLSDGSPDPLTPGAYRYQTRPDLCDLDAPDSDPSCPRYEPMHLRHKPGDTYLIDRARPYDVLDPGPFGSPGWFPDRRTGRHRRDELPDPIPWWEIEEEPEKAEWAEQAEALWERRTRITREREARERTAPEPADHFDHDGLKGDASRDGRDSTPEAVRDDDIPPGPPSRQSTGPEERPRPQSDPRPRPWSRSAPEPEAREPLREPEPSQRPQHHPYPQLPRQADRRTASVPEEPPHRFNKLREDAWDRFIEKSAGLAAAHRPPTAIEREGGPAIGRIARGIRLIAGLLRHRPRPREAGPVPPDRHIALADRTARFAQAMRGAQRARAAMPATATRTPETFGPKAFGPEAAHRTAAPEATRRTPSPSRPSPFIAEWERRFEARHHLPGGAAWA